MVYVLFDGAKYVIVTGVGFPSTNGDAAKTIVEWIYHKCEDEKYIDTQLANISTITPEAPISDKLSPTQADPSHRNSFSCVHALCFIAGPIFRLHRQTVTSLLTHLYYLQ